LIGSGKVEYSSKSVGLSIHPFLISAGDQVARDQFYCNKARPRALAQVLVTVEMVSTVRYLIPYEGFALAEEFWC